MMQEGVSIMAIKTYNTKTKNSHVFASEDAFQQFKDSETNSELKTEFTTGQAKVLDELSYLLSTEYEAVKWYDEAIPMIQASGLDEEIIASTVLGIQEIRKDEEDHIAHLERLVKQIKENQLIADTNGEE